MVLDGEAISHRTFGDLSDLLCSGDLLVLNETRVIRARLIGTRERSGSRVELLLLHPSNSLRYDPHASDWIALAKPARRLRVGDRVTFGAFGSATVRAHLDEGVREVRLEIDLPFEEFLARAGRMPIPPYIHNHSAHAQERYQTVFARTAGSVAAPTASLHFTPELLTAIERRGVEIARIALDIGLGTFRPVTAESIDAHVMHEEAFVIEPSAAEAIARARGSNRRIIAAGTTVVRALEGSFQAHGAVAPGRDSTKLFITPGFRFEVVDAMITNFHLPRSTLLILVAAFAGRERVLRAYAEAIAQRYRLYSFGDAMLILRTDS
jgi:S-adenosylmethionine:tRNA ribosyltransferase-isomerase